METRKPAYRFSALLLLAGIIMASIGASCSRSQRYVQILSDAESIADEYPDSALALIDIIDPSEMRVDSLKAQFYLIKASIHDNLGDLRISDSLIRYSADYYRDKDINRAVRSATLSALYDYWICGDRNAIGRLDSLSDLTGLPDSVAIYPLRKRAYWSTKLFDETGNRPVIKRLISIDRDSAWKQLYRYWLYSDYLFDGQNDSALIVLNELVDQAVRSKSAIKIFDYEYEKLGVLEEQGNYSECLELADRFLQKEPGSSVEHYIHLWKSLALFDMGNRDLAIQELGMADSCAGGISEAEKGYYNSFSYFLNTMFDFQNTGRLKLIQIASINNRQRNNLLRTQYLQEESEQSALEIENQRLILKAKSDRERALLIITVLAALLMTGALTGYARNKKRKALEMLERNEILQKLVDESKTTPKDTSTNDTLRRAMLQQLGIIKMVAETPTQQNREMLRKLSSVENGKDGSLVNWENVYGIVDNLYNGFYSGLHKRHGSVLTDREEQIIALMVAGFSTKEISVITGQTAATIYVRKSSVRKKLGVPEKEDIVAFLRQEADD